MKDKGYFFFPKKELRCLPIVDTNSPKIKLQPVTPV